MIDTEDFIIAEIERWLEEKIPTQQEVLEYSKNIASEDVGVAKEAARLHLVHLIAKKKAYFRDNDCLEFVTQINEEDQLVYIGWLSQYNASSVASRIKGEYPELQLPPLPKDIAVWSERYCKEWVRSLWLLTASEYLEDSVYGHTLANHFPAAKDLTVYLGELSRIYIEEGRYYERGEYTPALDLQKSQELLAKLAFLPEDYLKDLHKPEGEEERFILCTRLIAVLELLQDFGLEKARQDFEAFKKGLWEYLRLMAEDMVLGQAEGKRLGNLPITEAYGEIFRWLYSIWDLKAIEAEKAAEPTLAYLSNLATEQREVFNQAFITFLEDSVVVAGILDPVEPPLVTSAVRNMNSYAQVADLTMEINQDSTDPEKADATAKLLRAMFAVFQSIRNPQNVAVHV